MINNLHSQRIANPPTSNFDIIYAVLADEFTQISLLFNATPADERPHWMARFYFELNGKVGAFIDLLDKRSGKKPWVVIHSTKWREPVPPVAEVYILNLLEKLEANYVVRKGAHFGD